MKISITAIAVVLAFTLALPSDVQAQSGRGPGVTQIILFDYDGDEAMLVENFKKSQSIYKKINPEATMRLLYDEIHGGAVGRYRIHIDYPNVSYFGTAQGREHDSEEWQSHIAGRTSRRTYEGLSRVVMAPAAAPTRSESDRGPGVVQIILLEYDGDEAELVERLKKSQEIYAKINPRASMRLLYDELHGGAIGRYRLHIYYPNITYFGEAQGREQMSEEWQAHRKTRGTASTRTYEGLSRLVVGASS